MLRDSFFDRHHEIGRVSAYSANSIEIEVQNKKSSQQHSGFGESVNSMAIGAYICVDCMDSAVLGKITAVTSINSDQKTKIVAVLLSSYSLVNDKNEQGISSYPLMGALVYAVSAAGMEIFLKSHTLHAVQLAAVKGLPNVQVKVPKKDLLARHCAVVGNTGGGKSWSLAKIIEECAQVNSKFILLDATGEFKDFPLDSTHHLQLGETIAEKHELLTSFLYENLTVEDLFLFFRPSPQAQAPVLREAIRTLKLIKAGKLIPSTQSGCYIKNSASRTAYDTAMSNNADIANSSFCNFNIANLVEQIKYECIDPNTWAEDKKNYGFQTTLILRIESRLASKELRCLFDQTVRSLDSYLSDFLSDDKKLLRLSLSNLSFDFSTREIVINAFCRYLMRRARKKEFASSPLILAVDEAHNFFKQNVMVDGEPIAIDALDIIAKEGRKYGLILLLAPQRPKDIPAGVMSQVGSIICHRITNSSDLDLLKNSVGEMNKSIISILPTLQKGEAVITTSTFTFPITAIMASPTIKPDSKDPF